MSARRLRYLALPVVAMLGVSPPGGALGADAEFRAPAPVVRTLPNGLTVAVFHDDRLPIVQIQLLVPAGSAQEPSGEAGVASLTVQMIGQGTASRTPAAFSAAVEALGGSFGGTASREFTTVNGAFLASDFEAALELIADAVVHPLFDEERLVAVKNQAALALIRARQYPATLADEHLWAAVFAGHPYGRSSLGSPRTLSSLGVTQVRAFHRDRYRPDQALLAIAGDVTTERAFSVAEELLASWGGRTGVLPQAGPPPPPAGWRVRIVDAPGLARAELRIGTPGPAHGGADYDALAVAGELLAAGPPGGLRVGVAGLRDAGLVSIAASPPVDSVAAVLARVRAALARWTVEPPAEASIGAVRRRLAGAFALQFETRAGSIAQWMAAAYYAKAGERLADYPRRIGSLSAATAREAAARWVAPDRMVLVAVGPAERLRPQLETLGPVEVVPADAAAEVVEAPSTATTPPTPQQMVKGRSLASQAVAAHGGLERLRGIKDSSLEGEIVVTPGPRQQVGRMLQVRKEPDRFLFSTTFPILRSVQAMNGDGGWLQVGGIPPQVEDLDSLAVLGLKAGFRSDLQHLLLTAADPASRVAWRGQERSGERDADVIEVVDAGGERRLLFLDAASHQLMAMEQNEGGHSARRLYRDFRSVDGVLWPFSEERLLDGQRALSVALSRVAFNTGVKDEMFRRPGSKPDAAPAAPMRPRPR